MTQDAEIVVQSSNMLSSLNMRPPEQVLAQAREAAVALNRILAGKKNKVMFNKEQYLEFEDWQTVGTFYGCTAKVISTEPITDGGATGYLAKAVVVRMDTGVEISAADAMCMNDEEKWSARPKYIWKKVGGENVREQVGSEPVPAYQRRSMAQTRACAKALRNAFAWVVVLAGYKPTPAEELPEQDPKATPASQPAESEVRFIKAKFNRDCCVCGKKMPIGSDIAYHAQTKTACHKECYGKPPADNPAPTKSADAPGDAQE